MNWKDCAAQMELISPGARLSWPGINGLDCSQDVTISDVWGVVAWLWTYPGDWILSQDPLHTFFEIEGPTAIGAIGSIILGFVIAFMLIAFLDSLIGGKF
jgi:hypothetical protein